jgi:hypothetical protein
MTKHSKKLTEAIANELGVQTQNIKDNPGVWIK